MISAGPSEPTSAIIVRVPLPRHLERTRRSWDWAAGHGVPGHVTVLFPFLPPSRLVPNVRRKIEEIAAAHDPFAVVFRRVGRFPNVVYLAPEPAAPFTRLTEALVARFPDFQPYGGVFDEVIPHLTITESAEAPLDLIADGIARGLPFERAVAALEVIVERIDGFWATRWRIPLGDGRSTREPGAVP